MLHINNLECILVLYLFYDSKKAQIQPRNALQAHWLLLVTQKQYPPRIMPHIYNLEYILVLNFFCDSNTSNSMETISLEKLFSSQVLQIANLG